MKKILFIDRDGTLIHEPEVDWQVDSFDKFEFIPQVIYYLRKIVSELDYLLVMVTNQDGLGTSAYPESTFWPVHNKMLKIFENELIMFEDVCIDRSYEHENLPTRKPGTAMLKKFLKGGYDLENSFVIGDRLTDVMLGQNMGIKAVLFNNKLELPPSLQPITPLQTESWKDVYDYLKALDRRSKMLRITNETSIHIGLNLDGTGLGSVSTGIGFFDHMLAQIIRHGDFDIDILAKGDLHVDIHHTIEDTALLLGEIFGDCIGKKTGIQRYGFALPMDDAKAQVLLDLGGRSYFKWKVKCNETQVGGVPIGLFEHFFRSFTDAAKINLHIKAKGEDAHHTIEAVFKAFARALRMAVKRDVHSEILPSTKGML